MTHESVKTLRDSSLIVSLEQKYIIASEVDSKSDQLALAWCELKNGEMIISSEMMQLQNARFFCKEKNSQLWFPSNPLVNGLISKSEAGWTDPWTDPRPIHSDAFKIFDLFPKKLNIGLYTKTDLRVAWTRVRRLFSKINVKKFLQVLNLSFRNSIKMESFAPY